MGWLWNVRGGCVDVVWDVSDLGWCGVAVTYNESCWKRVKSDWQPCHWTARVGPASSRAARCSWRNKGTRVRAPNNG
jgi:hypothetical protein